MSAIRAELSATAAGAVSLASTRARQLATGSLSSTGVIRLTDFYGKTCLVVAAAAVGGIAGYAVTASTMGSISQPNFKGYKVVTLQSQIGDVMEFSLSGTGISATLFSYMTLPAYNRVFTAAAALYNGSAGTNTTWRWNIVPNQSFQSGSSYDAFIG